VDVTQIFSICYPVPIFEPSGTKGKPAISLRQRVFLLVAGARNHHYLRMYGSGGVEAAGLAQLLSQVQIIAVAGDHLEVLLRAVA
jgi:hypothetical protein